MPEQTPTSKLTSEPEVVPAQPSGAEDPEPLPLQLEVLVGAGRWEAIEPAAGLVAEIARAMCQWPNLISEKSEATVVLSDDAGVTELNEQFRGHVKPTNVLSFPADKTFPEELFDNAEGAVRQLGDIVLASETVHREAKSTGIPVRHHFQHLVLHGALHLIGFDHQSDVAAKEMEAIETAILKTLGIADPYGEEFDSPARQS